MKYYVRVWFLSYFSSLINANQVLKHFFTCNKTKIFFCTDRCQNWIKRYSYQIRKPNESTLTLTQIQPTRVSNILNSAKWKIQIFLMRCLKVMRALTTHKNFLCGLIGRKFRRAKFSSTSRKFVTSTQILSNSGSETGKTFFRRNFHFWP